MTSLGRSPSPSPSSHGLGEQEGQEQQSDVTPQREHPPIIRPVPVTPYSICNQPQPPQQQPPWSAFVPQTSAQRSQLDSATVESPPSTYTPYQATSLHSYSPHVPPGNPAPAARVPYYHPSPYSPWTGVPSSFVGQGGRVQGSGGSTSSGSGNFIPPSHLHLSPYGYAYPPYGPPFGGAPPPPRFPPHPASVSHPNAFPSVTGQRCGFSSLEEESARRDEEQGRSAQRKRLNPSTEGEGEEVDELESDGGTQRAAVAGWGAQVQASLSGEGSLLGGEEAEETKVKKPKVTRGVQPVNPYSIPPLADVKPFITKLRYILINPDEFGDVVCWDTTGTRVMIKMEDSRLADEVLPRVFSHSKPASFARQFSVYGFTVYRLSKDDTLALPTPSISAALPATAHRDATEWRTYHRTNDKLFTRDKINLMENLKALVPKETRKASAGGEKGGAAKRKTSSAGGGR